MNSVMRVLETQFSHDGRHKGMSPLETRISLICFFATGPSTRVTNARVALKGISKYIRSILDEWPLNA